MDGADPYLPIRLDARGGAILSSRCCGFIAETQTVDDAYYVRACFLKRQRSDDACPLCGKGRPMEAMG